MRDYARIAPTFWTRGTGKELRGDPEAQTFALFLMSAPAGGITGIFYLSIPQMCHETGLSVASVRRVLVRFGELDFAYYDEDTELVWVVNGVRHQLGEETYALNDKRRVGILRELKQVGSHPFVSSFVERYKDAYSLPSTLGTPSTTPPPPSGTFRTSPPPPVEHATGAREGLAESAATPSEGVEACPSTPSKGKQDPPPSLSLSISKSISTGGVGEPSGAEGPGAPPRGDFGLAVPTSAKPVRASRPKRAKHPLPDDFAVSAAIEAMCIAERLSDPHVVLRDVRDWALGDEVLKADWEATFRRWLRDPRTLQKHGVWDRPRAPTSTTIPIAKPAPPAAAGVSAEDRVRNVAEAMRQLDALLEPIPAQQTASLFDRAGGDS